jgi:hypothetical protein
MFSKEEGYSTELQRVLCICGLSHVEPTVFPHSTITDNRLSDKLSIHITISEITLP